jgi:hypothetical protein
MLGFTSQDALAIVVGASFAAGLNVYATVATLGLLSHTGAFPLPPGLHLIASWPVIIVSVLIFGLEFFADKIPLFDLVWNALHTFVRIPVAALLSYGATQQLSPGTQLAAALLGALLALAAHGGKIALRTAATPSPEPFSNMALSFGEDVAAVSLTWFATRHPAIACAIVVVALVLVILSIRYVVRSVRKFFAQARSGIRRLRENLT